MNDNIEWGDFSGNNTVNLIVNQVDKLTLKLMQLFNVKQESIDKVKDAFIAKQNKVNNADDQIDEAFKHAGNGINWRIIVFVAIVVAGLYFILSIIRTFKK